MSELEKKTKIPPNSKESEMMVLGCMLTSINSLNVAADSLEESDFYYTEHQTIFYALKSAYRADKPADIHLIGEDLKRLGKLDSVGGISYLTLLAQYAGTSAYIEEYVDLVREKSILRRMVQAAQTIERKALEGPQDVHGALDEAQSSFYQISQATNHSLGVSIKDLISGVKAESKMPLLKEIEERQQKYRERGPNDPGITGIPTHFIDLDKMLNGFMKSNLILLGARPAMGKCVVGDTRILDPNSGAWIPIREFVQRGSGEIVTLDTRWKLKKAAPTSFVADGIKPTFKITTALGREIEATAVHPLLTIQGWKRLEELTVGDRIAVPRQLPFFGSKSWSTHQLKLLAYLLGDGNLTNGTPRFTNNNPAIVEDFTQAACAFGPIRIEKDLRPGRCPTYSIALNRKFTREWKNRFSQILQKISKIQKKRTFQLLRRLKIHPTSLYAWASTSSLPPLSLIDALKEEVPEVAALHELTRENPVSKWLKNLDLLGKDAHAKSFPKELFELTKDNLALFINRLFSCDGTAYVANCAGCQFPVIAYSSVSKLLIHQLQHLLLRFGILSKIRPKSTTRKGQKFASFELEIHGRDNLIRFCEEIGIFGKEAAVASVYQAALNSQPGWSKDTLPIEIWDLIRIKKKGKGWISHFRAKGLTPPSNMHEGKRSIRRDTLTKIAHVLDDPELADIASSDVYWDRITTIESTGEQEVFDLSVPETHNFVAGDIIVHNTAIAINIAENICFKNKIPVGIFSLEMSASQLLHRVLCSQAEVESQKLLTGALNGSEYQRIVSSVNRIQKHTMIIDDQPGLKISDLRARARRMKEAHGVGFIVIDYLQLLSGASNFRSQENRQMEISEISRMLKTLAREIDVPILCCAQLSRKVEERQGHRPMMSDLRESGSLEQDSDVIMFLFRRDYYDKHDKPGLAELIVAKNRHGGVGDVVMTFRKEIGQFANYIPVGTQPDGQANRAAFAAFNPDS